MEVSLPQKTSYQKLALIDLLVLFTTADANTDTRELQTEFYNRFKDKFFQQCHHIAFKLFRGADDVESNRDDVFQDTFIKALTEIKDFKHEPTWNDAECEKVVLFWLGRIANNILLKRRAKLKADRSFLKEEYKNYLKVERVTGGVARRNYIATYDKSRFDSVWSKLNPMAKEIILLCAKSETLCEDNTKHLSDEDIAYLRKKYRVTAAAIRKSKERTIKALHTCKY